MKAPASELQTELIQISIAALVNLFCSKCSQCLPPARDQGGDWRFDTEKWVHVPYDAPCEWRAKP